MEDLTVRGVTKLELILNKVRGMAWTRFIWLRIVSIGGLPEIGRLNSRVSSNAGVFLD
jgi:hypothetical protein